MGVFAQQMAGTADGRAGSAREDAEGVAQPAKKRAKSFAPVAFLALLIAAAPVAEFALAAWRAPLGLGIEWMLMLGRLTRTGKLLM